MALRAFSIVSHVAFDETLRILQASSIDNEGCAFASLLSTTVSLLWAGWGMGSEG
jgi:hypothetical protein